jgi:hypothetical protein
VSSGGDETPSGCAGADRDDLTQSDAGGTSTGDSPRGDASASATEAHVEFDVSAATSLDAEEYVRPGVTAYLIEDYDDNGVLDSFLEDFDRRVGMVLYDGLDQQLNALAPPPETEADLEERLADADATIGRIVNAGGTVLLTFNCAMPDFLSSRQDSDHAALSGERELAAQTVSGCSPVRDQADARDGWIAVMEAVGEYFSKYDDQVVYMFGIEPENYFIGTDAELFDTYGLAIEGVSKGHVGAKIASITPVELAQEMTKANATYDAGADRYSYEAQALAEPLMKLWIEYAADHDIPLDFLTFHIWDPSSQPRENTWFEEYSTRVDDWLESAGYDGPPTVLLPTDFAGWENTCLVSADDTVESYYDSEYLGAMFVDHTVSSLRYSMANLSAGPVRGVSLVYGYLMDLASYSPCLPVVGGFAGFPGIMTRYAVPKPAYNALHFMTRLEGKLGLPASDDDFVTALGAYDGSEAERVSILLTRHLPSELHYVAPGGGFPGYSLGSAFHHSYGLDRTPLSEEMPNEVYSSYAATPDHPKQLVCDMLSDPPVVEPRDLGLSPAWTEYMEAAQAMGQRLRAEAAETRSVEVTLDGLASGSFRLQTFAVDDTHGNAYRARGDLQEQLDEVGTKAADIAALVAQVRSDYGPGATGVEDTELTAVDGTATLTIDMAPNSVWLVVLTSN